MENTLSKFVRRDTQTNEQYLRTLLSEYLLITGMMIDANILILLALA